MSSFASWSCRCAACAPCGRWRGGAGSTRPRRPCTTRRRRCPSSSRR
ncbi:MAG: hypothetical protein AVDCRST_MAG54-2207 [uncultured Actinomycetospora sp.]|uniref:Uncharacterized protein n=1 Tax=uncultured Actinomycetospora sp. TaxID=1135996 RepID=A0A6J4IN83_9PSEU|nr:MAG: hypothetical protein AVDCRST_MAG54-2207 [uncultured Actinomycetospora sp.]